MFTLTMHPASEGDCLQLTWGNTQSPHHAIIDLGRTKNYQALAPRLRGLPNVELLVISHIDADHIEGAVPMVKEASAPFIPADVWYNGYHHLEAAAKRRESKLRKLSPAQAEKLSNGILKFDWPWNRAFGASGIASVDTPLDAPLLLEGGLKITLLSPGDAELAALEPVWARELADANLRPFDPDDPKPDAPAGLHTLSTLNVASLAAQPFKPDRTAPNGSSIAFLAEYGDRVALLGADAFPDVIERSLRALGYSETNRLKIDLFKISHHGSQRNTSPSLLKMLDCTRFAISTDGSKHSHPDAQAIARILVNDTVRPKALYFNFEQPHAKTWQTQEIEQEFSCVCVFPSNKELGLAIEV
ncbi:MULTISPECIES: ComEC/Rec2 family competence protein [Rhizobium]|jgi:beta-lactamase superfamily II metal-dependent hydrolase|uniref:hypothetical protein n=1 Tax=Rhizobium TaxID=379 RepID=UPI000381A778|nr:hypothetical protein [Rhizobium ruizarguesonis]TAZ86953.1 hypothetical protein ELH67_33200 [Rhizobium ruizarguesonis]TBA31941.1 hypothetical protein ELH60_25775 [Rhizobium ruizarguesonis]TBA50952.1 hypothetical protein ELH59_31905 [Rhizobium ruizarguesonis]TBA95542.1 hypothetical protein ELH55_29845 [Rhizobium ruizarguesonis]TBB36604.1 hypothetical protein ELH46_32385 [Rhizobium ruizarguesonis]